LKEWLTRTDIANLTGLKTDTIYKYQKRNTLPEPEQYIGRTPVWKKQTINEWNEIRTTTIEKDKEN
jgi:predicted DNA-binding transcriptional regulator AlpA